MEWRKKTLNRGKTCRHEWTWTDAVPNEAGRQLCRCKKCGKVERLRLPVRNCHNYR